MTVEKIATFPLITMFLLTVIVAYGIAWYYRTDYEPAKMIKAYLIYAPIFAVISIFLQLKIVLIIGIYIFGAVILIFRNQHYFDK
ncbi:hypothetical protein ACFO26_10110 [Lactococcus nasutitermitis]|uniref:Uncharacterized protein n=1 Tax=Lactococcus nasutitermitis TaxID=1652957 RepID=A0ABV9JH27_9LACT|nr:hypothetical protein [Lactococcus nasutitermitis]